MNSAGFGFENDTVMSYISPVDIKDAAVSLCHPEADLVLISCTSLRASLVIDEIEKAIGKPVVSSNQALAWHSLKLVNYPKPIKGFGVLMSEHL